MKLVNANCLAAAGTGPGIPCNSPEFCLLFKVGLGFFSYFSLMARSFVSTFVFAVSCSLLGIWICQRFGISRVHEERAPGNERVSGLHVLPESCRQYRSVFENGEVSCGSSCYFYKGFLKY